MKHFRKMAVLALAALIVCTLSPSVCAYTAYSHPILFNEETTLDTYAFINSDTAHAKINLYADGITGTSLQLTGNLYYKNSANETKACTYNGVPVDYLDREYGGESCALSMTKGMVEAYGHPVSKLEYAELTFHAVFSDYRGHYEYLRTIAVYN